MIFEPLNPSDEIRHMLLKESLKSYNREEDLENIIRFTSPPPPITTILPEMSLKGKKIGIIGAGVAGLSCAYELRKLGCDITILEGDKNRIGGRIYTYQFGDGYYGEIGAMRIPVSHETTWHYINELKLNTNPFIQNSENNILYVNNLRFHGLDIDKEVQEKLYPSFNVPSNTMPLSELLLYVYNQPILNIPKNIRPYIISIRENYPKLININSHTNFREICKTLGLNNNQINLIYSVIGADSGFFYLSFLEILKEYYPASFTYLYEITGGFYKLPYAFYEAFQKNDDSLGKVNIKMARRVTDIFDKQNKVILRYLNQFTNNFQEEEFDKVICAIPFSTLRLININPLFSNQKMAAIRQINYVPSQKTIILFKERFWEKTKNQELILGGRIFTDLPITTTWFPSHHFNGNGGVLIASYNSNLDATRVSNLDEPIRLYTILRNLEEAIGLPNKYLDDKVINHFTLNWNTNDLSLGGFSKYYIEQNELFAHASCTPEYNNKVFFAGEHIGPSHGWVQSALLSGTTAANQIAKCEKNSYFKH